MKKALAIAGIFALSITPTASFANHAGHSRIADQNEIAGSEMLAIEYESGRSPSIGTDWISWTECYVNNHPDLISGLHVWIPGFIHTFPNGSKQYFSVRDIEEAGRLHYVLYGYFEIRGLNCPARN